MTPTEKQLLKAFRALSEGRQASLLDYAEYLASRDGGADDEAVPEAVGHQPLDIPRPETESVVKAIRRLSKTYPMVDRNKILHETSHFMTQHLIHKRAAHEIIDELETLFRRHYEALAQETNQG